MYPLESFDDNNVDMFVTMMYHCCTNEVLQSNITYLLTRYTILNINHEEPYERLYHDYFPDNCVYEQRISKDDFD